MVIVNQMVLGWAGLQTSRRVRQPAAPKPADPRRSVRPTPRAKYGLAPRRERLEQVGQEERVYSSTLPKSSSSNAPVPPHTQLYQQITAGSWAGVEQHSWSTLFHPAVTTPPSASPELLRKVLPAIAKTRYWPRIQRKILPRFLFVLNDVAAVTLLKTLVRLQPVLLVNAELSKGGRHEAAATESVSTGVVERQHSSPLVNTAPSSITGAFCRRQRLKASSAAQSATDLAAQEAIAVARGFCNAADELCQFELMLKAVYTVFQHKLHCWDGKRLVKLLGCVAQLKVIHYGFLQSWFRATAPLLHQQDGPHLVVCLEALAILRVTPPEEWMYSWAAGSQQQLRQLSLQQLAMLLLHAGELQLQLPDDWWQTFATCVLKLVDLRQDTASMDCVYTAAAQQRTAVQTLAGVGRMAQQQEQHLVLSRPAADSLCIILWGCAFFAGSPVDGAWLGCCLGLLLPAVRRQHCSASAAVQLLHACTLGACQQLPTAVHICQACLALIQQRVSRVSRSTALPLLLDCLLAIGAGETNQQDPATPQKQQLPQGFWDDLEEALIAVLPTFSIDVLVKMATAFGVWHQKPGVQLLSSFVLVTQHRVPSLSSRQVAALVEGCSTWGLAMPSTWLATVIQHMDQQVKQQTG